MGSLWWVLRSYPQVVTNNSSLCNAVTLQHSLPTLQSNPIKVYCTLLCRSSHIQSHKPPFCLPTMSHFKHNGKKHIFGEVLWSYSKEWNELDAPPLFISQAFAMWSYQMSAFGRFGRILLIFCAKQARNVCLYQKLIWIFAAIHELRRAHLELWVCSLFISRFHIQALYQHIWFVVLWNWLPRRTRLFQIDIFCVSIVSTQRPVPVSPN